MTFTPRTKFIDRDFGRLGYQVVDAGSDNYVVWCQEASEHLDLLWTDDTVVEHASALTAAGINGVVMQPRGVGISDPVAQAPSFAEQASDLLAVLDAEGITQATLVSHGTTAFPVALVAAQDPQRFRAIVMIRPGLVGPKVTDCEFGWTPETARLTVESYERLPSEWGTGTLTTLWNPGLATPYNLRLTGLAERCSIRSTSLLSSFVDLWMNADGRDLFRHVRTPTRVLSMENPLWPGSHAVASAIPGAELVEVTPPQLGDSMGQQWAKLAQHVVEVALGDDAALAPPERVLATVLFTDIVSSTDQLARLGDERWHEVLDAHDRMLRRHVAAHGGRYVHSTGDGALCEFPDPAAAVESARAICAASHEVGVEIRAGVHIGEISRRGTDVAGLAVHIGARVCAAAGAGEVLVSGAVRDLVAGGSSFASRGARELKGVPGSWELWSAGEQVLPPVLTPREPNRPADRLVLTLSRRVPGVLRAVNRYGAAAQRRRFGPAKAT